MSVPRHTVQEHADLETTAELPVLDVAAYEAKLDVDQGPGASTVRLPVLAAPPAPDVAEAPSRSYRGRLEEDLKSLSTSLVEFEERLATQSKRSMALESELEGLRTARSAAEQRATDTSRELTESRNALAAAEAQVQELMAVLEQRETALRSIEIRDAEREGRLLERERALTATELQLREARLQAATHLEVLQSLEGRRSVFDTMLRALDGEATSREKDAIELQGRVESSAERTRALEADLAEARRRSGELAARVDSLATTLAKKDEELSALARANEGLQGQVRVLTEGSAASDERAKAAELERQARVESHERELAAAAARQRELEAQLEERRRGLEAQRGEGERRIAALEAQVAELGSQVLERANALTQAQATHAEALGRRDSDAARIEELESRVGDYAKAAVALQEELGESRERVRAVEGDLRAAEEALLRLEGELRAKTARIEELTKLNDDWRETLEAARQSIEERDALIRRLETETAHSAALVDNIQHSIRSLEAQPADPATEEVGAAQSTARLLIRMQGDTEVVHVLGRKTSIGRTPDNDLQIDTKFVSRHHAVVLAGHVHTIVEDLNSTNGVLVNGQRVTRHSLKDGDAIVVGNAHFRFAVRPGADKRAG